MGRKYNKFDIGMNEPVREYGVVSVPHTGSNFLRELLELDTFKHTGALFFNQQYKGPWANLMIVPLRKPEDVWRSWYNRYHDPDKPEPQGFEASFWINWHAFAWMVKNQERMIFIPVDLPGVRDDALSDLSRVLGKTLSTDWEKVNSHGGKSEVPTPDLSEIYDIPVIRSLYR